MKTALLLMGKVKDFESYQIIAGKKYRTACFRSDLRNETQRNLFFDRISEDFAGFLIRESEERRIYFRNGVRMYIEKARLEAIEELPNEFVRTFHNMVLLKYKTLQRIFQQP